MSLNKAERKSVIDLFPYFNKYPVVFDVGSNKGTWADTLVDNVAEMHLFEPNELLLHYTMVKYDYARNVKYINKAVYKHHATGLDFYYFTNENNGLSSLYNYDNWDDLPKKHMKVDAITLDNYCGANEVKHIDFLKIDTEGAEFDVLEGAKRLLTEKRIKFIQVEYGFHYRNNKRTFAEMIDFLKRFGYVPYDQELNVVNKDTFVEDYRLENFIFMQEGFTQDWNGEFKKNTLGMKFDFALEIGAFEGLTSCYICDNLLNPGGRMIAVDPLTNEYLPGHKDNEMFIGQYDRFIRNTKGRPIELIRKASQESYHQLADYRFDFIYVDGDHREDAVFVDGCNAFRLCKVGGHILFDDYQWRPETKAGIDKFLNQHQGKYIMKVHAYQVLIQKTEN